MYSCPSCTSLQVHISLTPLQDFRWPCLGCATRAYSCNWCWPPVVIPKCKPRKTTGGLLGAFSALRFESRSRFLFFSREVSNVSLPIDGKIPAILYILGMTYHEIHHCVELCCAILCLLSSVRVCCAMIGSSKFTLPALGPSGPVPMQRAARISLRRSCWDSRGDRVMSSKDLWQPQKESKG